MNGTDENWATDFAVTPVVKHAVNVLRAIRPRDGMPAEAIGIDISFSNGQFEGGAKLVFADAANKRDSVEIPLTEQQQTAAHMLISVAAYHHEQMCAVFGEEDDSGTGRMPKELEVALKQLREDIRRKLNIDLIGYFLNELGGGVTLYN